MIILIKTPFRYYIYVKQYIIMKNILWIPFIILNDWNALFIKAGQFNHFDIGLHFKGPEHCEK